MPSRMTHDRWPDCADQTELWNVSGSPNQDATLEVGDLCYTTTEATLWGCTDATLGGAEWFPAMAITGDVNIVEILGHTLLDGGQDGVMAVGGSKEHGTPDAGYPHKIGGKGVSTEPTAVDSGDRVDAYFDVNGYQMIKPVGTVAHGSADSTAPIKIGGKGVSTEPTAVDTGDRVDAYFDTYGYQFMRSIGNIDHDSADAGAPIKFGGKASTSEPTAVASGDRVNAYFDVNGYQHVWPQAYDGGARADRVGEIDPISEHNEPFVFSRVNITHDSWVYDYIDIQSRPLVTLQFIITDPTAGATQIKFGLSLQNDGTVDSSCTYDDITEDLIGASALTATDTVRIDTSLVGKFLRIGYYTTVADDGDVTVYGAKAY